MGLNSELVMKVGYDIDISHIFTLDYIRQQAPSIPTPETHGILPQPGSGYRFILMSRIPGQPLVSVWKLLDRDQKVSVKEQLDTIFDKLRSMLPPPTDENEPNAVFGGGNPRRCKDARTHIRVAESPISNENEFNQFFTKHQELTQTNNLAMIKSYLETDHKLVMTHGDLHPRNIMVAFTPHQNESSALSQKSSDAVYSSCYPESQIEIKTIIDWKM